MSADADNKTDPQPPDSAKPEKPIGPPPRPREIGGPKGPEPTRYGDWEINGRCIDSEPGYTP